jgi:uncharacterized protein (TIGR01777 family)
MRVGVTGSTGLIGTAVVSALRERGDDVVRFVRPSTSSITETHIRWNPATGDVDESDLARIGGLDGVIHLAGAGVADHRWTPTYKNQILRSRTDSTTLLASIASTMPGGIATVVSGSAIGFYGSRGDDVLRETSAPGTDFLAQVCQAWEAATAPMVAAGAAVSLARTGIVLARRGGALAKMLPLARCGLGGKLGSGSQWVSPISLEDQVRALLFALDNRLSGPLNLVAPTPCTNEDLAKSLGRQLHRPAVMAVPSVALRTVLGSECAQVTVLASQRVVPDALTAAGFTFRAETVADILKSVL